MASVTKKTLTEHATFRINKEILDSLKSLSNEGKVSLNTIVNQILDSHINWDVRAAEVGWVVMLKSGLIQLIKHADRESILKIAKELANTNAKEIALFMRGKYGVNEWISILKDRARMSGFKLKEYRDDNKIKLVQHHEMGKNWSLFFMTYYETVFYELGVKVKSDCTDNSIITELEDIVS